MDDAKKPKLVQESQRNLVDFLNSTKARLNGLYTSELTVHIVCGNESADLDSVVAAVTLAFLNYQSSPEIVHLPLLLIPRKAMKLRVEIVYFLSQHGIKDDHLTFLDDLNFEKIVQLGTGLQVTLVDHHIGQSVGRALLPYVTQVLDHRPKDPALNPDVKAEIELVGSCCTLVARRWLNAHEKGMATLGTTEATLLLGTILTDTANMSSHVGVGTDTDRHILQRLKSHLPHAIDPTHIYQEIQKQKFNLSSLSVDEMLEKDCKLVPGHSANIVMSSITMPLEDVLARPEISQATSSFMLAKKSKALIIMTWAKDCRGLAVVTGDHNMRDQMADMLLKATDPCLDLQPMCFAVSVKNTLAYKQGNIKASRKKVLPLVRDFLAEKASKS